MDAWRAAKKRSRLLRKMLPQYELPPLHEIAHGEVLVEKVLNEELKHLVVELEGDGTVDQHPLGHLVQETDSWWRSKCVQHQVRVVS